ncbi:hypothetical protein GGS24DRAFT_248330 [Hypoxylon argillaceum]|nr:hypothetical protein GGS24DRAFT_248330 [Hypoxylon argillaceum]
MPIQFIDNSLIYKKKTRTLIRSHVAKGKNLGRTVHRPSRCPKKRQVASSIISTTELPSSEGPTFHHSQNLLESSPSIQRHLQEDLSTSLPFSVSWACRRLFHQLFAYVNAVPFPPELGKAVIHGRRPRPFLQFAFVDEAFFHCLVATSVAASMPLSVTRQETTEAIYHLSRSLGLINKRLAGDTDIALSDATIAVVISMSQHDRLLGNHRHALIHFEGLQRLIALKGGISVLVSDSPWVAQKAIRADFDFAIQFGSPTRFSVGYVPGKVTLDWLREKHKETGVDFLDTRNIISCVDENLRRVFEDISTLAWLVNDSAVHGIKVDDYDFHDVLLLLGYRLLNVRPLNTPIESTNKLEPLLHLGLVALIDMFFLPLGLKPDGALLTRCIASATLEQHYDDKNSQELLLWLLFTGKTSVLRAPDDDIWLMPKISHTASQLGLSTWHHVSQTLEKFPWVKVFANDAAQRLWNKIHSFSSPLY